MIKELRSINGEFDDNQRFKVVLPDDVGGDMTFNFELGQDSTQDKCHTVASVVNDFEAKIMIYNVPDDKNVTLPHEVEIGTYGNKQKLYLNYKVFSKGVERRKIIVSFYIEEE